MPPRKHGEWIRWGVSLLAGAVLMFALEGVRNRSQKAELRRDTHQRLLRVSSEYAAAATLMMDIRVASYACRVRLKLGGPQDNVEYDRQYSNDANEMLPRVTSLQSELREILAVIPIRFRLTQDAAQRLETLKRNDLPGLSASDLAILDAAQTVENVGEREVRLEGLLSRRRCVFEATVDQLAEALAAQL